MIHYKISADTQVKTTKCRLWGYALTSGGDNDSSLILYDEATSSKTDGKQASVARVQDGASENVFFPKPLYMKNGCYADLTGPNAWAIIYVE